MTGLETTPMKNLLKEITERERELRKLLQDTIEDFEKKNECRVQLSLKEGGDSTKWALHVKIVLP